MNKACQEDAVIIGESPQTVNSVVWRLSFSLIPLSFSYNINIERDKFSLELNHRSFINLLL